MLEINPSHPIVQRLSEETDEGRFADWSHILFDQATLAEGGQLDDPAAFVRRLNELMLTLAGRAAPRIWTPSWSQLGARRAARPSDRRARA